MAAVKAVLADLPKVVDRIRTTELCDRLGKLEGFQGAQRYRNLKERQAGRLLRAQFEDFPEIPGRGKFASVTASIKATCWPLLRTFSPATTSERSMSWRRSPTA